MTHSTTCKQTAILILSLFVALPLFAHKNWQLHYRDFSCVFNGYGDAQFEELSRIISSGIDDGLKKEFEAKIGSVPGNHRILGHGWRLNDSIPRDVLNTLSEKYPGREKDIIGIWQKFAGQIQNDSIRLTGLPKPQANALAAMLYDIHLLGDLEPDNSLIKLVLPHEEIVKNIEKDAATLFKNNPKYAEIIKRRLNNVLRTTKGKNEQLIAQALMDDLYRMRIGDMLHDTWGKTLKTQYSIDRVIRANEKMSHRLLQRVPGATAANVKANNIPLKKSRFSQPSKKGVCLRPGVLTADGRLLVAIGEGAEAGILVFALEGGMAVYEYWQGTIFKPEFQEKMVDAAIKGTAVGTAMGVAVLLGATPGGWVVFAVSAGVYIVSDIAITIWREHQAKSFLKIEDLQAYGIKLDTMLELQPDSTLTLPHDSTRDLPIDSTLDLNVDSTLELF